MEQDCLKERIIWKENNVTECKARKSLIELFSGKIKNKQVHTSNLFYSHVL